LSKGKLLGLVVADLFARHYNKISLFVSCLVWLHTAASCSSSRSFGGHWSAAESRLSHRSSRWCKYCILQINFRIMMTLNDDLHCTVFFWIVVFSNVWRTGPAININYLWLVTHTVLAGLIVCPLTANFLNSFVLFGWCAATAGMRLALGPQMSLRNAIIIVISCLENLEVWGNLTAANAVSGSWPKVSEMSGKNLVRENCLLLTLCFEQHHLLMQPRMAENLKWYNATSITVITDSQLLILHCNKHQYYKLRSKIS